ATLDGYSTPSTADVGAASLRLRLADATGPVFGQHGSVVLAIRRGPGENWLPAIGGVPGHHKDRAGLPRQGLLEVMIMARPTTRGRVTFLPEDVLRAWLRPGCGLQLRPLSRLGDFRIDDGSGPWLRDRICHTASEAEDFALTQGGEVQNGQFSQLLSLTGLRADAKVSPPPMDEWDLARTGQLHRDVQQHDFLLSQHGDDVGA
ncbi:unnamed protein product, partial [Polarella glacialis]